MTSLARSAGHLAGGASAIRGRALAPADPSLSSFGHDTWWLIVLKVAFIFLFLLLMTIFMIWA
jgi:hypothetical protein